MAEPTEERPELDESTIFGARSKLEARAHAALHHQLESALLRDEITEADAAEIRGLATRSDVREYLVGLGAHLALKAVVPAGTIGFASVAAALVVGSLWPLLGLMLAPALRTVYTASRMAMRRDIDFRTALWVGAVPGLGLLAFPAQMRRASPALWQFLRKRALSLVSR